MRTKTEILLRQNEPDAIALIKASEHCLLIERLLKYLMTFLSFAVCLAAIFNRYLPQMAPNVIDIVEIQAKTSMYLNLISGAIIVAGIPAGFFTSRMHTEGTVLRDRYEAYVFDNAPNLSILRPISQSFISVYANKVRRPDEKFYDYIIKKDDQIGDSTAQFDYINREVHADYNLYLSIQPFFITIWLGFCLFIIIIAISFNDMFVTTLINIMIPSLSAITAIGSAWHSMRLQMKQLTNLMTVIDQIQAMSTEKRRQYITDKEKMRLLSDGLFNYRSSSFVIPVFLVKHHQKSLLKNQQNTSNETGGAEQLKLNAKKKSIVPSKKPKTTPQPVKKEVAATTAPKKQTEQKPAAAKQDSKKPAEAAKPSATKPATKETAKPSAKTEKKPTTSSTKNTKK